MKSCKNENGVKKPLTCIGGDRLSHNPYALQTNKPLLCMTAGPLENPFVPKFSWLKDKWLVTLKSILQAS